MAVANTKSAAITAFDAQIKTVVSGHKNGSPLFIAKDSAEVAAADDDTSVYRMCRIPSGACIKELNVLNDAIAGGTSYHLGLYDTPDNNLAAVVDADLFGSVIDMTIARTLPLNAMFEAGIDIINGDQRVWELLGLSSDPHIHYDICFTGNTVGTGAGSLALEVVWSI